MKFIRVDMTSKKVRIERVPQKYIGMGGRGLIADLINDEVPARCDPLGPENKLIFAPGLLGGTSLVNTSRIAVGAKSPLTGTIKESNAGGTFGDAAGRLGITAVIIEGRGAGDELFVLRIDERGEPELIQASDLKKKRTYATVVALLDRFGEKNAVVCIGPAGEMGLRAASIQSTDTKARPCRAAGRGGLGAVMGSKQLKAIVMDLRGNVADTLADPAAFELAARDFAKAVRKNPFSRDVMPEFGTAGLIAPVNSLGGFPSYNATKGVFDGWEKISGEAMADMIRKRGGKTTHQGCAKCIIRCSNEFVDKRGKYVTSSLEYETIWSMGGMTGIDSLDVIARLDNLCDDIGIDTMSTGVAVAVAMDAGYKPFGDGAAAIEMVEQIGKGTDFGKILGNGPEEIGRHFGHHRVPVVKGQSISGYDPRAMQGNAVTYATSPMGADHTAGNLICEYVTGKLDPLKVQGQVEASRSSQISMAVVDSIGLCVLASPVLSSPEGAEAFIRAINAKLGSNLKPESLEQMGKRILSAERKFNRKAGFTNKDDRLPRFFYEEPLPPHNTVVNISEEDMDKTLDF
ncbi:MAG: aldehyde ferredoxin oxidoreductase [Desulfobacteraceae bacterium]|nr:aldehyde ferredoxin oxidoreductase [Desulfobacteraceae bacterium]